MLKVDFDSDNVLGVVLRFRHPCGDPDEVTRRLGIQPSLVATVGSHWISAHGDELPFRHQSSAWELYRFFPKAAPELNDISSIVGDILTMLEQHAEFVRLVATEGEVWIGLQFNGMVYRGFELASDLLRRIADLQVIFEIEVFPSGLG